MFAQISDFFEWRKCFDKGKVIGTLSKAFESRYSRIAK